MGGYADDKSGTRPVSSERKGDDGRPTSASHFRLVDVCDCQLHRNSDTYFPSNQSLGLVVQVGGFPDISSG